MNLIHNINERLIPYFSISEHNRGIFVFRFIHYLQANASANLFLFPMQLDAIEARNVKTSPAQMSLDAVMHGFRVRSQMLASQLEDEDLVLKHEFEEASDT